MEKKLISKNHLTPAHFSFSFDISLKNQQKSGVILGKFQSGSRPGTWCSR
jgi:hypothetical protein